MPVRLPQRGIQPQMRHEFQTEQWLPFPRPLVFAFFANPANLPPLMPRWQKARIEEVTLSPPPPRPTDTPAYPGVVAGNGTLLTITARALPFLPLRGPWDALIENFRWNEGFCDVQRRGPFAYWRHCHSVRDATSDKHDRIGTMVSDHVTYELPLQGVSNAAESLVHLAMSALFRYRQARTAELLPRFATACS